MTALLLTGLSTVQAAPAEISSARIIQPPPGAKVAAAYFTVSNNSDEPLVITGASSDAIPKVSIHLSAVVDDVAKMIPQDSVTIEAGDSLDFKHGSYHLMLMGLTAPLSPGTMLAFEIDTSAGVLPIMIPIITPDQASANESHAMKHDSMDHDHDDSHNNEEHDDMKASESMDKN